MYSQQPAAKRPRPSTSRTPATFHYSNGKPNPGQSSGEARSKPMIATNTTYKARQINAKPSPVQSSGEASSKSGVLTNTSSKARQVEYRGEEGKNLQG